MNINIHKIINLNGNKPLVIVHFRPFKDTYNVRCLNGSIHAKRTYDINKVTCSKCLNSNTRKNFWFDYEKKNGNENKIM